MLVHIPQPTSIEELDAAIPSAALKRVLLTQSKGQIILCGQCCVAMAANVTLQEAIIACSQVGATIATDLIAGLRVFQIHAKWRKFFRTRVPDECIIKVQQINDQSHWVYRYHDMLLNPARHKPEQWDVNKVIESKSLVEIISHRLFEVL